MVAKKNLIIKTRYGAFRCEFEREKDMGGYAAEAVGVNGALSWGKTLTEAKQMIVEAIEGAIEAKAIIQAEKKGLVRVMNKSQPMLAV